MPNITPRKNKNGEITSYTIRVYHGYDKTGKRLKPYTMSYKLAPNMTPRQIEKELNRQAVRFEEQCKNGMTGAAGNLRLSDISEQYFEAMKGKLSPTTYSNYRNIADTAILPTLGHHKIAELKPVHVQEFVKMLAAAPMLKANGQPYSDRRTASPATVKRKLAVLQSMLTFAYKLGYIANNPADTRRLTLPKHIQPEIQIFTKQEAAYILNCLKAEPLQFQTLVQLAIFTGARQGELVGLKFSDVDFFNNKLTISRSAYKLTGEQVKTKSTKSDKVRTVALNSSCVELLKELMKQHNAEAQRLGSQWRGENWVFTRWNGEMMYPKTPSKQFSKFLERNNIAHRKFHSLRHTSATLLLYNGTDLKTVQERLGHADLTTTNKYLHLVEQADVEAVNSLESLHILICN
ncbi:MAG: site-specific integrase [Ruminococcus sp.]|nr:site-specific integrase [Ruminococcus sp.]MCM1381685.1 site-specific integrase [Muribaculaceae bacterium]